MIKTLQRYTFFLTPPETLGRAEWEQHIDRKKEMEKWCSNQGWDHWGTYATDGFWFYNEENYAAFLLRWS